MIKLTSEQMAEFAASGLLRLGAVVPEPINQRFLNAITANENETTPQQHYQSLSLIHI